MTVLSGVSSIPSPCVAPPTQTTPSSPFDASGKYTSNGGGMDETPEPTEALMDTAHLPDDIRREVDAYERDHHAFVMADGSIEVVSDSRSGLRHHMRWAPGTGGAIGFSCSCEAGVRRAWMRHACWATYVAARRLERDGVVEWANGVFWLRDRTREKPAPFSASAFVD